MRQRNLSGNEKWDSSGRLYSVIYLSIKALKKDIKIKNVSTHDYKYF